MTDTAIDARLQVTSPGSAREARRRALKSFVRRFCSKPLTIFGLIILVALILMAIFAPWLAPYSPYALELENTLQPPSEVHWFGTDEFGRDIYSRILYGSRYTLMVVFIVSITVAPIGLLIGCISGYFGGWIDTVLMRVTDLFLSFPGLALALAFVAALGAGLENAIFAIALTAWPPIARLARAETLTIRSSDYIAAVRLMGASPISIIVKQVMPMCLPSVIIRVTLNMAAIILTAAGLGFLGLGAQPPLPEWGAMTSSGRNFILDAWWLAGIPGMAILLVSLAFNLLGDGLRDTLDPRGSVSDQALLTVEDLHIGFNSGGSPLMAVDGISFTLGREKLGIVGESGSGKSMTGKSILKLTPAGATVTAKKMQFEEVDLLKASERQMRQIRGRRISMILQDPKFSLNPVVRVGEQIAEAYRLHQRAGKREANQRAEAMLEAVQIRDPGRVFRLYPHEISGGMGQRVMIAMMLVTEPSILIADEPTSALDVTVRFEILQLLDALIERSRLGVLFISHDLNLVRRFCDRVIIMYAGRIVESLPAAEIDRAEHPYTRGLLAALPRIHAPAERLQVLERDPAWRDMKGLGVK